MKRSTLFLSLFLICTSVLSLFFFRAQGEHSNKKSTLPTHFAYASTNLKSQFSTYVISERELQKWDGALEEYFRLNKTPSDAKLRLYTYLYTAQRDAAFHSYNTRDCFLGSLDPLSLKIIHLFFPDFSPSFDGSADSYSSELAEAIFPMYEERFRKENENTRVFPEWKQENSSSLSTIEKWDPWTFTSTQEFIIPTPPSPEDTKAWNTQLKELKKARRYLTEKEISAVLAWSQEGDARSKDWRVIANDCLWENLAPIGKSLFARSALMIGLYDALIASFDMKYTYLIPRPYMLDPGIVPIIPKPTSPSFPSTSATCAWAAYEILSYFFSEECQDWQKLAQEASQSRVWAGVHFPIDIEAGKTLGKEVGRGVIENLSEKH